MPGEQNNGGGRASKWKIKWASREPRNEQELREYVEAFVENLEERYELPPRDEPEIVTRF